MITRRALFVALLFAVATGASGAEVDVLDATTLGEELPPSSSQAKCAATGNAVSTLCGIYGSEHEICARARNLHAVAGCSSTLGESKGDHDAFDKGYMAAKAAKHSIKAHHKKRDPTRCAYDSKNVPHGLWARSQKVIVYPAQKAALLKSVQLLLGVGSILAPLLCPTRKLLSKLSYQCCDAAILTRHSTLKKGKWVYNQQDAGTFFAKQYGTSTKHHNAYCPNNMVKEYLKSKARSQKEELGESDVQHMAHAASEMWLGGMAKKLKNKVKGGLMNMVKKLLKKYKLGWALKYINMFKEGKVGEIPQKFARDKKATNFFRSLIAKALEKKIDPLKIDCPCRMILVDLFASGDWSTALAEPSKQTRLPLPHMVKCGSGDGASFKTFDCPSAVQCDGPNSDGCAWWTHSMLPAYKVDAKKFMPKKKPLNVNVLPGSRKFLNAMTALSKKWGGKKRKGKYWLPQLPAYHKILEHIAVTGQEHNHTFYRKYPAAAPTGPFEMVLRKTKLHTGKVKKGKSQKSQDTILCEAYFSVDFLSCKLASALNSKGKKHPFNLYPAACHGPLYKRPVTSYLLTKRSQHASCPVWYNGVDAFIRGVVGALGGINNVQENHCCFAKGGNKLDAKHCTSHFKKGTYYAAGVSAVELGATLGEVDQVRVGGRRGGFSSSSSFVMSGGSNRAGNDEALL